LKGITSKPLLASSSSWVSSESPLLDNDYFSSINGIDQYEIKINETVKSIFPTVKKDWKPTYLDPFTAPSVPVLQDLPEGQYAFSLRIKDLTGLWSPWSDSARINIDRGFPIVGKGIEFRSYQDNRVELALTDFKDEGTGLCLTQIINADGWVTSRSEDNVEPTISVPSNRTQSDRVETYDCLGNGQSATLKSAMKFVTGVSITKRGTWKSATTEFPTGSIQCVKSCSMNVTIRGNAGLIVGSGSIQYGFAGEKTRSYKAKSIDGKYEAIDIFSGSGKSLRITGKDFVVVGIARGSLQLEKITKTQRTPQFIDDSLMDSVQKNLSSFGFTAKDFASNWTVLPMNRGTTLEDPSLDLCAADYESESSRRERRQVVATKPDSPYIFLSSEVVKYSSTAAAKAAVEELKDRLNKCLANSGGKDKSGTFVKYSFLEVPRFSSRLVDEEFRVVAYTKIGEPESQRILFAVYQFQGVIFSGLYVVRDAKNPFDDNEILRWLGAAESIASRLKNSKSTISS
jgi:hypothetical protein